MTGSLRPQKQSHSIYISDEPTPTPTPTPRLGRRNKTPNTRHLNEMIRGPHSIKQLMTLYSQRRRGIFDWWFSTTLRRDIFDEVFPFLIREFLHEPILFMVEMKQVRIFHSEKLALPLRACTKPELHHIHQLLKLNQKEPIFQVDVGLEGYSIRYSKCKYNALVVQQVKRLQWVKQLCRYITAKFPSVEQKKQCWGFMKEYLTVSLGHFSSPNHPLRKSLQKWMTKTDLSHKNGPSRGELKNNFI